MTGKGLWSLVERALAPESLQKWEDLTQEHGLSTWPGEEEQSVLLGRPHSGARADPLADPKSPAGISMAGSPPRKCHTVCPINGV